MSIDAITIQVLRNKIASLVDEMHYHFYRSGYSTIIRESRDFSCVVLDKDGRLIVAPPMFFHAPVYRHLVARILEVYGPTGDNSLRKGDVFISNHPYEGGMPHVSDMAFVAPVFADSELIAFTGSIAHKADIGGTVPGSTSATATELFHEGLLLPPVRITEAGRFNADLERVVLANSRQPELVRGDVRAQIAVTETGAARVAEFADRFGANTLTEAFRAILSGSAEALRERVRALPEGVAEAEGFMDSDGIDVTKPVRLHCRVEIKDGLVTFDFSKSDPQARGPINLRPSMCEACGFYALIGALGPDLHFNDGMRDVARFVYAPRTITNASPPAPVSSYQATNLKLVDVILEALATFVPKRATANAGSSGALSIAWAKGRPGQSSMQYEILGSAYGAGPGHDGASATATHLSNLHITPIEILESEFPCRVTRFEMVADSGGAGEFRGGLAFRREYVLLEDATVIRRYDRAKFPPNGIAGGKPGRASRFVIRLGTEQETTTPASGRFEMKKGERFLLESAGGGGYGVPEKRAPGRLASDEREGYVTPEAARGVYGKNT